MISGGIPKKVSNGEMKRTKASNAPELLKIEIDTIMPTKKGSKENAILTPSFPPSTNNSYVGTFCHVAMIRTNKIKQGINHVLIDVIMVIFISALPLRSYSIIFCLFSDQKHKIIYRS